jgi:hypothetical protein
MPARQPKPPSERVTLSETINWIAFDDFDGPELSDAEIGGVALYLDEPEQLFALQDGRERKYDAAVEDLFKALRSGDIQAAGFLATKRVDEQVRVNRLNPWTEFSYMGHEVERSPIPSMFWDRMGVKWHLGLSRSYDREYTDIVMERRKVLELWPLPDNWGATDSVPGQARQSRRGRKPQYSEQEFLALCVCEANVNGLPDTQAEFVESMAKLASVLWGQEQTPGETWLKERVRTIYEQRERHEKGRKSILD